MNKKLLFLFIAIALYGMMANAATKYNINVGGVEVTSDNKDYIHGGDILEGYTSYDPDTKTLTLHNTTVWREAGSGDYGIHNRGCEGLTIVLKGDCMVYSEKGQGMKLEKITTIKVIKEDAPYVVVDSRDNIGIDINGGVAVTITGDGELHTMCRSTTAGKPGIKGGSNSTINFDCNKVDVFSYSSYAVQSLKMNFKSGTVDFDCVDGTQIIKDCSMTFSGKETILSPMGAYYSNSSVYLDGSVVDDQEIRVSDDYVAIINSSNFPDANFRSYLLERYPKGYINSNDVDVCNHIDVSSRNISSLVGLGYLSKFKFLYCSNNNLTSLPTLPSTLVDLQCQSNKLTSLPSLPVGLYNLNCSNNQLTSLPQMPNSIRTIYCSNNKLNSLAVSGKSSLTYVDCSYNPNLLTANIYNNSSLSELLINNCSSLLTLGCYNNQLTKVDLSGDAKLQKIWCQNNEITTLNDLMSCISLTYIDCSNNQLTNLAGISVTIETINCDNNKFTTLNVSSRNALKTFYCRNNTSLTSLYVQNNALTTLDVTGCGALQMLYCNGNKLTSLSLQGCNALNFITIARNQIKGTPMTSLINTLRTIPTSEAEGTFDVYNQDQASVEGNEITDAQVEMARTKRWKPQKFVNGAWVEIGGGGILGDVNCDGSVNAADITALYNYILNGNKTYLSTSDVNNDNAVNAADVTAVYSIILGQN